MKKIVSLLLTVALLATMISAFAMTASAEAQAFDNSTVTWKLTENDTVLPDGSTGLTLTIGGKGKMPGFNPGLDKCPWKDSVKVITTAVIDLGVTNIGDCAFYGYANLQSVTISSSVASIDQSAFYRCTNLQSVTISSSLESIGSNAFMNCSSLQSVTIPSSVASIGNSVFNGCGKLASVTVKASTPPTLGKEVFNRTSGKLAIYVPCGLGERYQQVGGWSEHKSKIKEAYIVDDQPGENGTIMLDKDCFPKETYTAPNQTVTVTVMPAGGYLIKSLFVVAENGGAIALTRDKTDPMKYTFTMPRSNVTVKAEFEEIPNESEPTETATESAEGSTLSEGNIWIIIAVAVLAIGGVAALVIVKKKKKPALASGENTDEE